MRWLLDKVFTSTAGLSVLILAAALVVILGPMLYRGAGAVFFQGTVEWRKMQLREELFSRGDSDEVAAEEAQTEAARKPLYDILDRFGRGVDASELRRDVRRLNREVKKGLRNLEDSGVLTGGRAEELIDRAKELRDHLQLAYEPIGEDGRVNDAIARRHLDAVLTHEDRGSFAGTRGGEFFRLAEDYDEIFEEFCELTDRMKARGGFDKVAERAALLPQQLDAQLRRRSGGDAVPAERRRRLVAELEALAGRLATAYAARKTYQARAALEGILECPARGDFAGTRGEELFALAESYSAFIRSKGLSQREQYREELVALKELMDKLFGPRPGERAGVLLQERYGATRWDMAADFRGRILTATDWVLNEATRRRERQEVPRRDKFDGKLDRFFDLLADDETFAGMMNPRFTFYWQYFIDDCTPGHYAGGVGPEIMGTLLITLLAMVFAVPTGIITAAYLVECTRETPFVRIIRTCINTLAGVPSIVFGLFGLAFFLLYLQPKLGMEPKRTIFAGALTLGVLVLPIVIRASEEAIRAVPRTYKEASLSLGAGGFRTFVIVTMPAALPGILTGIILSMSRAAGETAPILFTAAVASRTGMPTTIFKGGTRALSYSSYDIAVSDRIGMDVPHNQYGMIMTLVALVLLLNVAAILIRSRVAKKLRGQ
jgi:phosphate transport system permease protein